MHLRHLYLYKFRNYEEAAVRFTPGVNIIWGKNGQGKTNLAEAIYLLMTGRSFRTPRLQDLAHWGGESFFIKTDFVKNDISQQLSFGIQEKTKKVLYNQTPCRSLSSMLGILPGVFMAPDDDLIKGPPQVRRQFLDLVLVQSDPLFLHYLNRYARALVQRNILLKIRKTNDIEVWEETLAKAGAYISAKRRQALQRLRQPVQDYYSFLGDDSDSITQAYLTKAPDTDDLTEIQSAYSKALQLSREKDLKFGSTSIGPHRDEVRICLEDKEMRLFSSEGQKRSAVAALRLASWNLLKQEVEHKPLMIIDDLDAGLDLERRQRLIQCTRAHGQVFITSTERPQGEGVEVRKGKICPS